MKRICQTLLRYWIGGSDGRVNYSRVTALVGNVCWLAIVVVVLTRMDLKSPTADAVLWVLAIGTLGMLGVNLGQYGVNTYKTLKQNGGAEPGAPARRDSGIGAPAA